MNISRLITTVIALSTLLLLVYRIFHSVDLSDEAYGIAEIYNSSIGKKPLIDIWDPHTGWFLYSPLLRLFETLTNGFDGIILFFRLIYLLFVVIVMGFVYLILRNQWDKNNRELLFLACVSSICYVPFSIPQVGYNAGVSFLLILVFALLYSFKSRVCFLVVGILMGITCLLYPTMAALTVVLTIFICFIAHNKAYALTLYSIGVILVGGLFSLWITMGNDFGQILECMKAMTSTPHEMDKGSFDLVFLKNTFFDRLSIFFSLSQIIAWVLYLCVCIMITMHKRNNLTVELLIHAAFLIQQYVYVQCNSEIPSTSRGGYLLFTVFFVSIVILIQFRFLLSGHCHVGFLLLIGWVMTYCLSSDNKNMFAGFDAAGPLVMFIGAFIVAVIYNNSTSDYNQSIVPTTSRIIIPILIVLFGLSSFFGYIYRDESFSNLDARVNTGIYKGLYTTEERKAYVEKLETDISKIINKSDCVCLVNNMPALYLMCKADICAPQTWDSQYLNRGYTSAQPLLSYFEYKEESPDIMIANNYIDNKLFSRTDAKIWDYLEQYYYDYDTFIEGDYVTKIWKKRTINP